MHTRDIPFVLSLLLGIFPRIFSAVSVLTSDSGGDTHPSCHDNPSFRFQNNAGIKKNCSWIRNEKRRAKYCPTVGHFCPVSCHLCETNKKATMTNDEAADLESSCSDSLTFRWKDDEMKTCDWIGRNIHRRGTLCQRILVRQSCPQTCRSCPVCADDESFRFQVASKGSKNNCHWLTKNQSRQQRFCNQVLEGALIGIKCPYSCGICPDSGSQGETRFTSDVPSESPTPDPIGTVVKDDLDTFPQPSSSNNFMAPSSVTFAPSPSPTPSQMDDSHHLTPTNRQECRVDITLVTSFDYLTVRDKSSGEICSSSSKFCDFVSTYTHDIVSLYNASSNSYDVRIVSEEDSLAQGNLGIEINGVNRISTSWRDGEDVPVIRMVCSEDCSCTFMKLFF